MLKKYETLAGLFDYPDASTDRILDQVEVELKDRYPGAHDPFQKFCRVMRDLAPEEREEVFTTHFDLDPRIPMDLGFILFGEDYRRGNFLALMQAEQSRAGNDLRSELADHLPNVLRLVARIGEKELAEELAASIVLPAVKEMVSLSSGRGPGYRDAFETLHACLAADLAALPYESCPIAREKTNCEDQSYACGADFLQKIVHHQF